MPPGKPPAPGGYGRGRPGCEPLARNWPDAQEGVSGQVTAGRTLLARRSHPSWGAAAAAGCAGPGGGGAQGRPGRSGGGSPPGRARLLGAREAEAK